MTFTTGCEENLLTPIEVSKELRLDVLTVYKYIRSKKLLAIKFGRKYMVKRKDLAKFINSNKTY